VLTSSVAGHQVTYWEPVSSASKHAVHDLVILLVNQEI
jgi:NADP-dependent 3-hydroxy acid dehydrogenase YdfG